MEIEIKSEYGSQYFEATEDGRELGEVAFRMDESGKHMTITHVGVNPQFRGAGKAGELVGQVVDYARQNDIKIKPVCSYAKAYFKRHADQLSDVAE